MAVRAVSRFTVQSTSEDWLVHALVGEVIDRLREQRSVQMAFATWPAPDMLQVHS